MLLCKLGVCFASGVFFDSLLLVIFNLLGVCVTSRVSFDVGCAVTFVVVVVGGA